ncbi:MAG: DUF4157 domain-containing protein [Cyanobacteria bacterium P01_D01_bin.156]
MDQSIQRQAEPDLKEEEQTVQRQAEAGLEEEEELPVQTKLTIGQPGDKYEQEADQMAAKVMRMPDGAFGQGVTEKGEVVQRQAEEEEEIQAKPLVQREEISEEDELAQARLQRQAMPESQEEEELQTRPAVQRETMSEEEEKEEETLQAKGGTPAVPGGFEGQLASHRGGGQPLSDQTRAFMEPRFGADFGGVRVHETPDLANAIQAQAFTHGQDIYFNSGKYNPGSSGGKELLAHELTHTLQQSGNQIQCKSSGTTYWEWYQNNKGAYDWRRRALKKRGYKIRRLVRSGSSKSGWEETVPTNITLVRDVCWSVLPKGKQKWEGYTSETIVPKLESWLQEEKPRLPYNDKKDESGNTVDPEMKSKGGDVIAPSGKWDGGKILHRLTQIDVASLTLLDDIRCVPHAVLAVHIQSGARAVKRVAKEAHSKLGEIQKKYPKTSGDIERIRHPLSSAINNKKIENFTYSELCLLAEALYIIANAHESGVDYQGTNFKELKQIDTLGHAELPYTEQDEIEKGEVSPGSSQKIREFFGAEREPRRYQGKDAVKNLPKPGKFYTHPKSLHNLAMKLQNYRDVALMLAVPFANQGSKPGHEITLGVNAKGQVYLYDPWPRSGSQTLYYPRQADAMEKYFEIKVIVRGRVAAASPNARSSAS